MLHKTFSEMGIPPGYGFKKFQHSPIAHALVVQTQSSGHNWRPERLYFRKVEAPTYQSVGAVDDLVSQEFPFVHPSEPLLAYNCMVHKFPIDEHGQERHSGDWDSLRIFNLENGSDVDSIGPGSLKLPDGTSRGWIAGIVTFDSFGLYVTVGLSQKDAMTMDYFVAKLELKQRTLDR